MNFCQNDGWHIYFPRCSDNSSRHPVGSFYYWDLGWSLLSPRPQTRHVSNVWRCWTMLKDGAYCLLVLSHFTTSIGYFYKWTIKQGVSTFSKILKTTLWQKVVGGFNCQHSSLTCLDLGWSLLSPDLGAVCRRDDVIHSDYTNCYQRSY